LETKVNILKIEKVSVRFGGHIAINNISLEMPIGTITGLIGPNGAGKTTLFNVISGLLPPSQGEVYFDGRKITTLPPYRRARIGLGRTFQRLELFTSLTVKDNIRVAAEIRKQWSYGKNNGSSSGPLTVFEEVERAIELTGLADIADRYVTEIPTGQARLVELARALTLHPKLLILDEPASGQDETETEQFGYLLRILAENGTSILLVEHDMGLVMTVCNIVHVLDFGEIIAIGTPKEIQSNTTVLDAYLGSES